MKFRLIIYIFLCLQLTINCANTRSYHINSIKRDIQFYKNRQVTVKGRVVKIIALPFIDKGFCKIDDGSGEIWVKPLNKINNKGDLIILRGTVRTGFKVGSKTFGIIIIEDRK